MSKTINYVTNPGWWDTDRSLLLYFPEDVSINLIVLMPHDKSPFQLKEIESFAAKNNINVKFFIRKKRIRNIKNFMFDLKVFEYLKNGQKRNELIFITESVDPYLNMLLLFLKKELIILSIHNFLAHTGSKEKSFERTRKFYLSLYKNFHFHSLEQYRLFTIHFPAKNSFYTYMPVKDFGSADGLKNISREENIKRFLFFGRIEKYKGLDLLISAVNEIEVTNFKIIIAGNSKEWEYYEKQITDKSRYECNIKFIENKEVPDYFLSSDFLILPYSDTTQSGPLLIAYNYNLPVIASDLPYFKEMIDDEVDGFIFKKGNKENLKERLIKAGGLSTEEYKELKDNQKKKIHDYQEKVSRNTEKINDIMEKIYSEL